MNGNVGGIFFTPIAFANLVFDIMFRSVSLDGVFLGPIVNACYFRLFGFVYNPDNYLGGIVEFAVSNDNRNGIFCLLFIIDWILDYQPAGRIDRIVNRIGYDIFRRCPVVIVCIDLTYAAGIIFL